jgi:hypothetical protein
VATSPAVSMKVPATFIATTRSDQKSKTHPLEPYNIIQGKERVIGMMEETL